jgi:sulfur carrier protein
VIEISLNGEPRTVAEATSVRDLLMQLGLTQPGVAVEVNCELVPFRQHAETVLASGDRVEIVTLVGGG